MKWLARPLLCDGVVVLNALDLTRLTDADLASICLRMHVILETIEMPRCEGRHIPVRLFDAIDTLESHLRHGDPTVKNHPRSPRLADWSGVIREFGEYYGLAGSGPVSVDSTIFRAAAARYVGLLTESP